jgi:RimJ/RimL family protein N-acetyltransferase
MPCNKLVNPYFSLQPKGYLFDYSLAGALDQEKALHGIFLQKKVTMNWIQHPVVLTGKQVKLIPLEHAHIDELCARAGDPAIWAVSPFDTDNGNQDNLRAGFIRTLEKQLAGEEYNFTILLRKDDSIIGTTKFWLLNERHKSLEIGGTWMQHKYWGTGLNTESKYLQLKFCFETLNTVRVQIKANENNLRSRRAIEKLGAAYEGLIRKDKIFLNGTTRNSACYSFIDDEWTAVKERLEEIMEAGSRQRGK